MLLKRIFLAGSIAILGSTAVQADDHFVPFGTYLAFGAGAVFPTDGDVSALGLNGGVDYATGPAGLGAAGYRFTDSIRAELEIAYRTNDVNQIGNVPNISGDLEQLSVLVNGVYDFIPDSRFSPYVGAGIGIASGHANDVSALGVTLLNDSDEKLAYQGIVGVSFQLTDRIEAFADYRYFATQDYEFNSALLGSVDVENATHNAFVGIRIMLGETP